MGFVKVASFHNGCLIFIDRVVKEKQARTIGREPQWVADGEDKRGVSQSLLSDHTAQVADNIRKLKRLVELFGRLVGKGIKW